MASSTRLLPLVLAGSLLLAAPLTAQSPTLLRLRNAASADRLTVDSAGTLLMRGAVNGGAVQDPNGGTLLTWYPRKSAFRAGTVSAAQWNDVNVGSYSTATGYNTTASGSYSTAMGIGTTASGHYSTAMGAGTTASGQYATAMGWTSTASGYISTAAGYSTTASGYISTAIGDRTTASGDQSVAIGTNASTNGQTGAIVFADASTISVINATAAQQFSVRASGGVRIFTSSTLASGVTMAAGGSGWNAVSDRRRKEQFVTVDGEDVLARIRTLPVSTWRYTAEEDRATRHIGPMAQDWHAAFGFSSDSLTINTGDFDGVNLAAAQALLARTDRLQSENAAQAERIRALDSENALQAERMRGLVEADAELRAELASARDEAAALRARLARLEALVAGGRTPH